VLRSRRPSPSYASGTSDETIRGTVAAINGPYNISVRDERGFVDNVNVHQGAIINPTGLSPAPGLSVTILGKDGVRSFFEQLARGYEITKFDPREFISAGDHVVALVRIAGHARETGVAASEDTAHVFRIRNGKISEFREYADARSIVAAYALQAAEVHA
jgi:ketosteroid isomerase-like protein